MVTRPFLVIIVACYYTSIIQKQFPRAVATRVPIDEFMIEDQRTHRKQNYVVQRALNGEMLNKIDNIGPSYRTESFASDKERSSPEELPALIVDYANMIRNDIILLDNSVEARTRKRGNIKRYNEAITDPPCSCGSLTEEINLGSDTYPQRVESIICNEDTCPPPYRCKANYYYMTVLRRKAYPKEQSPIELPTDLSHRWIARKVNITTGCVCARDRTD